MDYPARVLGRVLGANHTKESDVVAQTATRGRPRINTDDLTPEIVQPLVELNIALVTHARAHRDRSLAEHEDSLLAA